MAGECMGVSAASPWDDTRFGADRAVACDISFSHCDVLYSLAVVSELSVL